MESSWRTFFVALSCSLASLLFNPSSTCWMTLITFSADQFCSSSVTPA